MDSYEEFTERSYLDLEKLILNVRGDVTMHITNEDNGLTFVGTEEEISEKRPQWLSYRVSNIFTEGSSGMLRITITEKN